MSGMTSTAASRLSVAHLKKSYGGAPALKDASLDVDAGEVLALMGENGAGKSTLIKILAGAVMPDGGVVALDGEPVTIKGPQDAYRRGLRFIHQEMNIVPQLSVAENLFLGRPYPTRAGCIVDWRELHARARVTLDALGVRDIATDMIMARLPIGDRMLVKIASTFLEDTAAPPRLFVMDEPTAALTSAESERLFHIIAELRRRGCGILYVSHRIDEVLRISSRISVLRDGETRAALASSDASKATLVEAMTGRAGAPTRLFRGLPSGSRVALSVQNLSEGDLRNISFDLHEGEILGVAGLANAGQERLLKILMSDAKRGEIFIGGKRSRARSPAERWRKGIAYVPAERRSEGLFLSDTVTHNVVLPHLRRLNCLRFFINRRAERAKAAEVASRVRLKSTGLSQRLWQLSGGNQQKVMFGRAVAGAPRVLVLDEPTRGVDIGAKFDIYSLLRELAAAGAAILISSSDHEELLELASRIAILRDGRICAIAPSEGLTQQRLLALCYGDAPE
jgi:ABC-type sugar transport system ATPase subunit